MDKLVQYKTVKKIDPKNLYGGFKFWNDEQMDLYLSYRSYGYGHLMAMRMLEEVYEDIEPAGLAESVTLESRDDYKLAVRDIQAAHLEDRIQSTLGSKEKRIVTASNIAFYLRGLLEEEIVTAREKEKKPSIANVTRLAKEFRGYMEYIRTEATGLDADDYKKMSDFQAHQKRLHEGLTDEFKRRVGYTPIDVEVEEDKVAKVG